MPVTICTWNINSARLRIDLIAYVLETMQPDVLCLQETKSLVEKLPVARLEALGYGNIVARGQKGYNGVATISRHPLQDAGSRDFCAKGDARHVAARLPSGLTIHNYYVPAGGDEPDPQINLKFRHKLDFLSEMTSWFGAEPPQNAVLVGDLNIAPRTDDVWSHKALLKVVSHTPQEVEALTAAQEAGSWIDGIRHDIPEGHLYSWWSYRARDWTANDRGRRLDHIWVTQDLKITPGSAKIWKEARGWQKPSDHVPVFLTLETEA